MINYTTQKLFYILLIVNVISSEKIKRKAGYKEKNFDTK